ncbi:MAG TPA: deoxyribodipyrimidine photo-lyase [Flavisolibacter sp.]|nr:deoxyribodipyrimidine photo-lyase [Flavisolibacter sp.]
MPQSKEALSIFWFRRDLRVHDNHGLWAALKAGRPVLPIFIYDTKILDALHDKKDRRVVFIHRALQRIQSIFTEHGGSLLVLHDTPEAAFQQLLETFTVADVFTNGDYEPYAKERDGRIEALLQEKGIPFHLYKDQVIFEKSEVAKKDGKPYTVFTPYSKVWRQNYEARKTENFPSEKALSKLAQMKPYPLPTLQEIGFEPIDAPEPDIIINEEVIRSYHETRNLPGLQGTSGISVHLRFGTVSVREIAAIAHRLNPVWLNEIIWREFFMSILYHFPHTVSSSFKPKYDAIQWRNNEEEFRKWCRGETGYPLVDAGMRQLHETGWMHNRVRLVVSSFMIKHLLIDWRWGEAYFAEKLNDYELASNVGNWQWAAGSGCDAAPYFRVFNPAEQLRKFDPELRYVRTWIKDYKPGYLQPMVVHEEARKRALDVYKRSLAGSST